MGFQWGAFGAGFADKIVKDQEEANKTLADVRKEYTIAKGQDPNKKDKYGKELINLSFVK